MTTPRDTRRKCATIARHTDCDGYGCDACDHTGRNPELATPAPTTNATTVPVVIPPRRPGPGRPPKIDTHGPAVIARIRKGMDAPAACERSGIGHRTFERWLAHGYDAQVLLESGHTLTDAHEQYRRFLAEYLDASHELHERLLDRIHDLVPNLDAREALALLERLRRSRWGRVETHVITAGEPGGSIPFTERYADTLADLLRGILADLGLSDEQREAAPQIIERNLARVSAREGAA